MATYYSGWVATDDWRIRMDCASASPANSTTGTVYVHCAIESRYGVARYGAQIVITVAGQSQTVRTGAISSGATSWASQVSFAVGRGHSATGVSISARATCPESGVSPYMSGTSVSGSETLAAVTSHTTTYDGNGGTVNGAAQQKQTKWYGALEYVPTYTMARDGYGFLGWGTAANSTSVSYVAGQAYSLDIDQTLYAVWKRLYIAPAISQLSVVRATSDGTEDNEGTYAAISLSWAVDTTLDGSNVVSSVTVAWKEYGSSDGFGDEAALAVTGTTSGTATGTVGAGGFDTAKSYQVRVTVSDSGGSSQATTILSPSFFTIDLAAGGKGVGVLCQAPAEGVKVSAKTVAVYSDSVELSDRAMTSSVTAPMSRLATAIQPVVLYNGGAALDYDTAPGAGTKGNVTLSETAAHFRELTIFFTDDAGYISSTTLPFPDGKGFGCFSGHGGVAGSKSDPGVICAGTYSVSGTTITKTGWFRHFDNSGFRADRMNLIKIVRVEGRR